MMRSVLGVVLVLVIMPAVTVLTAEDRRQVVSNAVLAWLNERQAPSGGWPAQWALDVVDESSERADEHQVTSGELLVTSSVLRAFLAAGYDHRSSNRYRYSLRRALDFMRTAQAPDGYFGHGIWEHLTLTAALAEYAAATEDPLLDRTVERALELVLEAQMTGKQPDQRSGWGGGGAFVGIRLTLDAVRALDAAARADIRTTDCGIALEAVAAWMDQVFRAVNPEWQPGQPATFPSSWQISENRAGERLANGTALWCGTLVWPSDDPRLRALAQSVIAEYGAQTNAWGLRIDDHVLLQIARRVLGEASQPSPALDDLAQKCDVESECPWPWWRAGPIADRLGPYAVHALGVQAIAAASDDTQLRNIGIPD